MTVFIVVNHYDFPYAGTDKNIAAVFKTNEAAEAFIATRNQNYGRTWDEVEEYEVN